jgi:hypothetical protein
VLLPAEGSEARSSGMESEGEEEEDGQVGIVRVKYGAIICVVMNAIICVVMSNSAHNNLNLFLSTFMYLFILFNLTFLLLSFLISSFLS